MADASTALRRQTDTPRPGSGAGADQHRRQGTLERGLALLDLIGQSGRITASEAAGRLGLSRSATYRILSTLRDRGYVEWDTDEQISLGFRIVQMGTATLDDLDPVRAAHDRLRSLAEAANEVALLGVRDGDHIVYLARAEAGGHAVNMRAMLGARRDLHSTSLGKSYLSALPVKELHAVLGRIELTRHTPTTLTDVAALRADLDAVRRRGYAIDDVENEEGVFCVGAPVRDRHGNPVCALSVAGPEARMRPRVEQLGDLVRTNAYTVSRRLGYEDRTLQAGAPAPSRPPSSPLSARAR